MEFIRVAKFNYNDKTIVIFLNDLGEKTLMEEVIDGVKTKYKYLDFKDYTYLYNTLLKKNLAWKDSKKYKFIPKVKLAIGGLVILTTLTGCTNNFTIPNENLQGMEISSEHLFPYKLTDKNEMIITDDYVVLEDLKKIHIYTNEGLHKYYTEVDNVTYEDLRKAMNDNPDIVGDFKTFLSDFIDKLEEKYPNIDLTVFYYNIKNANVQFVTSEFMPGYNGTSAPRGCFIPEGCKVYINTECSYEELEQVVPHEIGHMLVNMIFEKKGYTIQRDFCKSADYGFMVEEALNSKFVDDLMEIDAVDLPYQMPVNFIETFMEATNYTMEDYLSGSLIDYNNLLIEHGIIEEDAARATVQIELQKYNIRGQQDVDMEDSEFACLYEVYSYVYFNNMIKEDMTHDEIVDIYMKFYNTLTYKIDYEDLDLTPVYNTLLNVLNEKGIKAQEIPNENELPITNHSANKTL